MDTEIALNIVGLVLNVFGLPTGLFSKIKNAILIGKDIAEKNKLSDKGKFIRELTETATKITSNDNCSEDVIKNIEETLTDSERFSAKKILEHINDVDGYITELTQSYSENDPSAEGYKSAMKQLLTVVYKNLQTLGVASDSDEMILKQLYSFEKLSKEDHAILLELKYRGTFAEWLDGQNLLSPIQSNIFNYRNQQIGFYGRERELEELQEFMEQKFVSVWGIAGPGGSGKSKLARQFEINKEKDIKTVWLDANRIKKLLSNDFNNDYNYPLPVLFICDYSAQYEDELRQLIEKFCCHPSARVKFLLLERQKNWYLSFAENNDLVCDNALKRNGEIKEPIDLTNAELDEQACKNIIHDLAVSKDENNQLRYPDANLQDENYAKIIARARELSENKTAIRCLFMLLLTDAFLRGEKIQEMDAAALMKNYITHSKDIMPSKYHNIVDEGFHLLAYATACGGLKISDIKNHTVVKTEWETIRAHIGNSKKKIISFFNQLSESNEQNMLAALKPDLIGEFLFLNEWNDIAEGQEEWLSELLNEDESRTFLARCLTDWQKESNELCNMLSDVDADEVHRGLCASVFNSAVREAHSAEAQMSLLQNIKALDDDYSVGTLNIYVNAVRYVFEHAIIKATKDDCVKLLDAINFDKYSCENNEESDLFSNAASVYQDHADYDKALDYYKKALAIREKVLGTEHPDTATTYNNMAIVYKEKGDYDKALEYYEKALAIVEKVLGTAHPSTATTYNGLAGVYYNKGNYDKALEYYEKALAIREKMLGTEHPDTATIYNNMASVYDDMGDYDKALEYYEKDKAISEKVLGTEHPSTATTYNNMAGVYKAKGDYDKALEYYEKALAIREKVLGTEHPSTATTYNKQFCMMIRATMTRL